MKKKAKNKCSVPGVKNNDAENEVKGPMEKTRMGCAMENKVLGRTVSNS